MREISTVAPAEHCSTACLKKVEKLGGVASEWPLSTAAMSQGEGRDAARRVLAEKANRFSRWAQEGSGPL